MVSSCTTNTIMNTLGVTAWLACDRQHLPTGDLTSMLSIHESYITGSARQHVAAAHFTSMRYMRLDHIIYHPSLELLEPKP